jgi:hypothetical protein
MKESEKEYEVKEILQTHIWKIEHSSYKEILIKWTEYERLTWKPLANFEDMTALDAFQQRFQLIAPDNNPPSMKRRDDVTGWSPQRASDIAWGKKQ